MSLGILNENKDIPEEYRERVRTSRGPGRLCVAAEQEHGAEFVLPLYTALGTLIHHDGRERGREMYEDALAEVGLPVELAELADSEKYDDLVRASHERGMADVGEDVGSPILVTERFSIFGPVISPAPTGERAGMLWDAVSQVAATEGFFELKRTRNARPDLPAYEKKDG
jgi:hypothetical protein